MPAYPGHDTDFFIVLNGVVTGPLKGLDLVRRYNITPDTPVWYDGLEDWKPAIMAPLTRQIFEPGSPYNQYLQHPVEDSDAVYVDTEATPIDEDKPNAHVENFSAYRSPETQAAYGAPVQPVEPVQPPKIRSYLIGAIAITVIFNFICGIIAIIYACKVKSKYARGLYDSAERCSQSAQWWIAGGITLGLVSVCFQLFTGGLL